MNIHRLRALRDNYIFVLHDPEQQTAVVIDPGEASPVLHWLKTVQVTPIALWVTHHHPDHVGGILDLLHHFPAATVYGSAVDRGRIPAQQVFLEEGDRVSFGGYTAEVWFIPGHTQGHIAYYFPVGVTANGGELFCGDTLFAGGCGRLLGGTPSQLMASLARLRALPDATRIWCAHEYTLNNLKFALTVEPHNLALQERYTAVSQARRRQEATIPSILSLEKQTNPFLRWDTPTVMQVTQAQTPLHSFTRLRGMKDQF